MNRHPGMGHARGIAPAGNFGYCSYGGYRETKARATGFFRVEQTDGRWWLVDPDGHRFLSVCVLGLGSPGYSTQTAQRSDYFAALPQVRSKPPEPGHAFRRPAARLPTERFVLGETKGLPRLHRREKVFCLLAGENLFVQQGLDERCSRAPVGSFYNELQG